MDCNDDDAVKNTEKQAVVALAPIDLPLVAVVVVTAGVAYAAAKTVHAVRDWIFD